MAADGGPRELRLEGLALALAAGVFVVIVVGAFFVGRWVERASSPAPEAARPDPLRNVAPPPSASPVPASFFDTSAGAGQEAEPHREVAAGDGWEVQVFAGRDRGAAEEVVRKLERRGESARLEAEGSGPGALYKVRVAGFATREQADRAAQRLRGAGLSGAFVRRSGT